MNDLLYEDLELLMKLGITKGMIAGGRAFSYFHNVENPTQDIDIFFKSENDFNECMGKLESFSIQHCSKAKVHRSDNANTYYLTLDNSSHEIQLIKKNFGEYTDTLDCFDITNCMLGYIIEDSRKVYSRSFFISESHKEVDIKFINKMTPYRIAKILARGYTLSSDSICKLSAYDADYFNSKSSMITLNQNYEDLQPINKPIEDKDVLCEFDL